MQETRWGLGTALSVATGRLLMSETSFEELPMTVMITTLTGPAGLL